MSLRYVPSELEQRAEQLNVLCKEKQPELPEWIDTTLGSDCHVCIQMRGVGHNYKFPEDTTWRRLMACLGEGAEIDYISDKPRRTIIDDTDDF